MPIRHLLSAVLVLLAAPCARAQALAQMRFDGALTAAARIEVEVGADVKGQARRLDVHAFLGAGTTGADVATLVASRLEAAGFYIHLGDPDQNARGRSLFVERALFLNLRLGAGVSGTLTACEGMPSSLRVLSAPAGGTDLQLEVVAGTFNPASKTHGRVELGVTLPAGNHVTRSSEQLMEVAAAAKWVCDRPKTELWRPVRMVDGSRFTGLSVGVAHGWRIEMQLAQ